MSQETHDHTKVYLAVFAALMVLTVVTVSVSYLHLPRFWALSIGLLIACVKGSLVAAYFMHLVSEKTAVFSVLALSAAAFTLLLVLPWADLTHTATHPLESVSMAAPAEEAAHVP